jgi:hypothetical protein
MDGPEGLWHGCDLAKRSQSPETGSFSIACGGNWLFERNKANLIVMTLMRLHDSGPMGRSLKFEIVSE